MVDDDGGTQRYIVPGSTNLAGKKCISFQSGLFNWNISSSDMIRLFDSSGNPIEQYIYEEAPLDNKTIGRIVDGEGELGILPSSSRDKLNSTGEYCLAPVSTPTPSSTSSPTSTPDSTNTSTPTPTPTPSPTATPTKTPTPTPKKTPTPEPINESMVEGTSSAVDLFGLRNQLVSPSPTPEGESTPKPKTPILAFIFIVLGIILFGVSGFTLYKGSKGNYNGTNGSGNEKIL